MVRTHEHVTRDNLNDVMEFDHVIEIHADGTVSHRSDLYAPELYDGECSDSKWQLLTGYSGQDRYPGPIMHDSEYIGGMADDLLSKPGVYVAIVSYYSPSESDESEAEETSSEGWAVARLIETDVDRVERIVKAREISGADCDEEESALLKGYLRERPGSHLARRIATAFPLEFAEVYTEDASAGITYTPEPGTVAGRAGWVG